MKIRRSLKITIILAIIWFAIALPVPFLWLYPSTQHSEEFNTYLIIAAVVTIPLIIRRIIWIKNPKVMAS